MDDTIPLFAFVGRVTNQKGVHLILDMAENIIARNNGKIQFIVGGPANMREPYSSGCAHKMWHLKNKFPYSFWAAPDEFFTDGSLVNRGADFGLMPSAFEPGGIVQHEFFVGATPVVAFKTGGLKDSVIEFDWNTNEGSGFVFDHYNHQEFEKAVDRAMTVYKQKNFYRKLRENAFHATMSGEVVCKAWLGEFCRIQEQLYVDKNIVEETKRKFDAPWRPDEYQQISIIQEIFGQEKKRKMFCDIDFGAHAESMANMNSVGTDDSTGYGTSPDRIMDIDQIVSSFDQQDLARKPHMFTLHNSGPRYNKVQVIGSFNEWKTRVELQFDDVTSRWFTTMHLKPGAEYNYKYVVNDQYWIVNDEEPKKKDNSGNMNNYVGVFE